MIGQGMRFRSGTFSAKKRLRPTFANPIALSIPARTSTIRAGSLPDRSSAVIDLVTNAPNCDRSMKSADSNAYPHVPEHVMVGLESFKPARFRERTSTCAFYESQCETQASPDRVTLDR